MTERPFRFQLSVLVHTVEAATLMFAHDKPHRALVLPETSTPDHDRYPSVFRIDSHAVRPEKNDAIQ